MYRNNVLKSFEKKKNIQSLEARHKSHSKKNDALELHKLRNELQQHFQKGFNFYIQRLRLQWYAHGNK